MSRLRPNHIKSDISVNNRMSIKDMDTISLGIHTHFSRLTIQDMRVSEKLAQLHQDQSSKQLAKTNIIMNRKVCMIQEVKHQKALINSRKSDFRISKAQQKKYELATKKYIRLIEASRSRGGI
jgi:hypothetical protein